MRQTETVRPVFRFTGSRSQITIFKQLTRHSRMFYALDRKRPGCWHGPCQGKFVRLDRATRCLGQSMAGVHANAPGTCSAGSPRLRSRVRGTTEQGELSLNADGTHGQRYGRRDPETARGCDRDSVAGCPARVPGQRESGPSMDRITGMKMRV